MHNTLLLYLIQSSTHKPRLFQSALVSVGKSKVEYHKVVTTIHVHIEMRLEILTAKSKLTYQAAAKEHR
jgi:hypothetical protein